MNLCYEIKLRFATCKCAGESKATAGDKRQLNRDFVLDSFYDAIKVCVCALSEMLLKTNPKNEYALQRQ